MTDTRPAKVSMEPKPHSLLSQQSVWVPEKTQEQTSPQIIINASYVFVKLMKTTEISTFLLLGEETDTTEVKIICLKSPSTAS